MTKVRTIPGAHFNNAKLKPVRTDPILPSAGALFLADCTHPANPWASGVPANGGHVPNLAWPQAAAAIGSGSESSLRGDIYNLGLTSTAGLVERTTKGGLHGIVSPTYSFATDGAAGLNVAIPAAIYDYTRANKTHKFYLSVWWTTTRSAADYTGSTKALASIATTTTPVHLMTFSQKANLTGTLDSGTALGSGFNDVEGVPEFRWAAGTPGSTYDSDAVPSTHSPGHRSPFLVGNRNFFNAGSQRGKGGSRIFYRTYFEDLTVSGRTPTAVQTIDAALFAAIVGTSGGRYYGDTFTNPATIA